MTSLLEQIIDSSVLKAHASAWRCQAIFFACTIFNLFGKADAFSIQESIHWQRQHPATRIESARITTKSIPFRSKRVSQCDTLLNEQSLATVQNESGEESNVILRSEHEGYTFQSQAAMRDDQLMNASSTLTPSCIKTATIEIYNPISDLQMMTLKSKIPKYMVTKPASFEFDSTRPNKTNRIVVLWRNLMNDTPELHGYPISFLSEQMKSTMQYIYLTSNTTITLTSTELALKQAINDAEIDWDLVSPYMDAYTFEMGGGVTGLAYGVTGVADGTQICTSSVGDVQSTILRNYILTGDGCLYELGRPAFSKDSLSQVAAQDLSYSLSGTTKEWFRNGKETASLIVKNSRAIVNEIKDDDAAIDSDLWQLAGLTTLVLSGAMAMETLSHHLTVNVFWV